MSLQVLGSDHIGRRPLTVAFTLLSYGRAALTGPDVLEIAATVRDMMAVSLHWSSMAVRLFSCFVSSYDATLPGR